MSPEFQNIDFSGLTATDAIAVECAIRRRENFHPFIPSDSLNFIILNHNTLKNLGVLEAAWPDAYVHAGNFVGHSYETIKSVFDNCDRSRLRIHKPLDESISRSANGRVTVFRGCAGPIHKMGMSWSPSLETAIKYAKRHVLLHDLNNPAVYVAIVSVDEIYCQLDHHYDEDLIVVPNEAWKIDVPQAEFQF